MAHPMQHEQGPESVGKTAAALLKLVQDLAVEIHPRQPQAVTLDSAFDRDLGLDSLARVELLSRIERSLDVSLSEQVFASVETPRDLLRAVLSASGPKRLLTVSEVSGLELGEVEALPHSAQTLVEVLDWHILHHPDRPHIRLYSDEGKTDEVITYRQLRRGSEAVATGLQQTGLQPGDPIAIMLPTGRDYFYSFYGILLAGCIPVPLYPPARLAQLEDHLRRQSGILANCRAATLITVPEAKRFGRLLKSQVESLRTIVTAEELSAEPGVFEEPALGAQDIAFLQYTSGSTGNPKGVVLTHANLLTNIRVDGEAIQADPTDVFVSWLPLYHDMGLIGAWLGSLYYAIPLIIMSPLAFLTRPQRWLWAIHHYHGTLSAAPNFAYELCLHRITDEDIKGLDLSSWRVAFNGAEPVSPVTLEGFCERFRPYGFRPEALMPVYGLAESTVGLAFPPLGRGPIIDRIQREPFTRTGQAITADEKNTKTLRFVACGQPLRGHEIRIVGPDGRELPERQEGHLQFRGPSTTSGYFRNPEATRDLFQEDWLDSGDLAYVAGGDIYLTGRIKDIIIRAGRNICSPELEEAVGDVPGIRKGRVVAFGSTDPESGTERLVVLAETRETDAKTLAQLHSRINAITTDLAGTPPDDVVLAPPSTVLKTSSGKIRRAASRELYEHGRIGKTQKALWWQLTRLTLAGVLPQVRRLWRLASSTLYATYVWTLFVLLVPIVWLSLAVLPRFSWRWGVMRACARILVRASGIPLSVQGLENLPRDRPCVLVSNHASYLDGYALVAVLPFAFSFVAKAELTQRFRTRFPARRIGAEFVERFDKQKGIADARRVAQAVRAGNSLLFFPEGTFTRVPGLRPFHMGAFVAAVEANVPIVPIVIRGTRSILRSDSWFPRRGSITVSIGKPIEPERIEIQAQVNSWVKAIKLRDAAHEHILRHCGEPDLVHEKALL